MYIDSIFNYTGSKFKLLNQIIPNLDKTKTTFIDLFTGGGSVYSNVIDIYDNIIINDIIPELIEIQKSIIFSDDIIFKTKSICPDKNDKEGFLNLRKSFNNEKNPEKLWALMLSCTNNLMRFNKSYEFNQSWGNRSWNSNTDKKVELFINKVRPYKDKITFLSKHFNDVEINKPSMVYIDSPYSNSEAGYNSYWNKNNDDKLLYEYCKKIDKYNSSFMLSGILGEHKNGMRWELIDKLISDGYKYIILDYNYEKVARIKNDKKSNEVIIMNY